MSSEPSKVLEGESYSRSGSFELNGVVVAVIEEAEAAVPVAGGAAVASDDQDAEMHNIADHHGLTIAVANNNNNANGGLKDAPSSSWSWYSNLFFLFGSLSYVVVAGLAIHIDGQMYSGSTPENQRTASPSTFFDEEERKQPKWQNISYFSLAGAIAALWFFGNAVVDLAWVVDDRRHHKAARFGGDDPRWDIGLAVTFGIAASCDFFSCLLANYQHTFPLIVLAIAAVHIYLVYALVALSGRSLNFASLDQCLTSFGDVLFLFGSVIDVVLSYFLTKATTQDTWRMLDYASMVSALLWTSNAVLSIAADITIYYDEKRRNDDPFVALTSPNNQEALQVDLTDRLS